MHKARILALSVALSFALGWTAAIAQQPAAPAATPEPTPKPTAENNYGYPDIESLREPGSSTKLFPDQPPAVPDPTQQAATRGGGRRNGGGGGQTGRGRNSGRRHDVLADQADADPLQVRVAYRRAKTVAMSRDSGLAELLQRADRAGTDPEKRAFLKQYYTRLYDEVGKIDRSPEMKKHLETLRQVSLSKYEPRRRDVGGDEDLVQGRGGRRGGGRKR